ncbi:MAG: gliding motility-associated C-terminal domain-containing protein, partial [Bacteroidota bacterium]|nr:gliding motility-associated C-terminal domain-containing protein [Bacteroidota bacterium]
DTIKTITYPFNESVSLEAIATNGWRFSHWDKQTNILNPSEDNSNVNFTVESSDNIRANFEEIFNVYVPNSFTPANDDNLHNTFDVSIFSAEGVKYEFEVFNRFGESLFYSNDESISWDGSSKNGSQVPSGVYIYMLTVKSNMTGKKINKKGSITLLR